MKITSIAFLVFVTVQSFSQSVILFEQDSVSQVYEDVDISNPNKTFSVDLFYKNNTSNDISVHWKREISSTCPSEWDISTSDQILDYVPAITESQIAIQMASTDSHFTIKPTFWPNNMPGCCNGRFIFFLEDEPNNPIDTGYFNIEINSNCITTSTSFDEEININIFPNPATDILSIDLHEDIKIHHIYDSSGNLISKGGAIKNHQIDVSFLPKGQYFLHLALKSEKTIIKKFMLLD